MIIACVKLIKHYPTHIPCVDSCPERTEDESELVKLELQAIVSHQTQTLVTISCLLEGQEVLIIAEFSLHPQFLNIMIILLLSFCGSEWVSDDGHATRMIPDTHFSVILVL